MNLSYATNPADVARGIVAYSKDIRTCRCGRPTNTLYRDYTTMRLVSACCPEHVEPADPWGLRGVVPDPETGGL